MEQNSIIMGYFNSTLGVFTTFSNEINNNKKNKQTMRRLSETETSIRTRLKPGTLVNQASLSYHDLTFSGHDYLSLSLLLVLIIFKQCVR